MAEHPPPVPKQPHCRHCGAPADPAHHYCPWCGRLLAAETAQRPGGQGGRPSWYYEPIWIAVMALLVLGPFALPLVFKSPKLSRNGKIAFTAGIALYTLMIFFYTIKISLIIINEVNSVLDANLM